MAQVNGRGQSGWITLSDVSLRMLLYALPDPETWCSTLAEIRGLPEVRR